MADNKKKFLPIKILARFIIGIITFSAHSTSHAQSWDFIPNLAQRWDITPSLTFRETYTDNLNLAPSGSEESCFATEVNPGLSVRPREQGGRVKLNFNLRLQGFVGFTCGGASQNLRVQNQSSLNAEIIKKSLFLDARSAIFQQNITNTGRLPLDNLSRTGNRTDVRTFSVSPYWTPHLGGYAEGEVRLRYTTVTTGTSALSDSNIFEERANLHSGSRFTFLNWRLNFLNRDVQRDRGRNVRFQHYTGEMRFRFNREFSAFVQGGDFNNDFGAGTRRLRTRNGAFYTVGGAWTPSRRFRLEGGVGNNSFITVFIAPSRRTSWETTLRDNEVGTVTGRVWRSTLKLRSRRTVWQARYFQDVITVQQLLPQEQVIPVVDEFGEPILDPVTQQPIEIAADLPTLTDDVISRRRFDLSFTGRTAKSTFNLRAFRSQRTFQERENDDEVIGGNASWTWRFASKTQSLLRLGWVEIDNKDLDRKNERLNVSLRITRRLSTNMNGYLQYRFVNQDSNEPDNEFQENRFIAALTVRF